MRSPEFEAVGGFRPEGKAEFVISQFARRAAMQRPADYHATCRRGFTLVELLVVIAIIGVLVGLLLPAIQAAREAGRRSTCSANQKQIALALLNHHETKGTFPRGQETWLLGSGETGVQNPYSGTLYPYMRWSWFFRVLPYVEQQSLYDQQYTWYFKNPYGCQWNAGATNCPGCSFISLPGVTIVIPSFVCPSDYSSPKKTSANAANNQQGFHGNHVLVAGNTAFNPSGSWSSTQLNGIAFPLSAVRIKDVTDGTSKTMAVGEILVVPDDASGWAAGNEDMRGRYHNAWEALPCISTRYTPNTSVPDRVANCNAAKVPQAPCTPAGSNNHMSARSNHPGGVNVAFADGSTRFVVDAIDPTIFAAWGSRNGGEVAAND